MNRTTLITAAAIILAVAGVACSTSGFTFDNLISVPTPLEVQQSEGFPPKMKLPEARKQFQIWFDTTKRVGNEWSNSIDDGGATAAMLDNFTLGVIEGAAGPYIASTPALALLVGYFTKRRKDKSPEEVAKEKESSYNAGLEAGKRLGGAVS